MPKESSFSADEEVDELVARQAGLFHERMEGPSRDRVSPWDDHEAFLTLRVQREESHVTSVSLMGRFDEPDPFQAADHVRR